MQVEDGLCLTGLRPDAGAVDGDGVTALAQATQERLGEGGIAEEVLPRGIWKIRSDERRLAPMSLLQELEEDVGLLGFDVGVSEFVELRYA